MVEFIGNNITMNRGDTVYMDTVIYTQTGEVYELQEGDILTFSVYNKEEFQKLDRKAIIRKEFIDRKTMLESIDTRYMKLGRYDYECVIETSGELEQRETYLQGELILKA